MVQVWRAIAAKFYEARVFRATIVYDPCRCAVTIWHVPDDAEVDVVDRCMSHEHDRTTVGERSNRSLELLVPYALSSILSAVRRYVGKCGNDEGCAAEH